MWHYAVVSGPYSFHEGQVMIQSNGGWWPLQQVLDFYGRQDWELVSADLKDSNQEAVCIFKRNKPAEAPLPGAGPAPARQQAPGPGNFGPTPPAPGGFGQPATGFGQPAAGFGQPAGAFGQQPGFPGGGFGQGTSPQQPAAPAVKAGSSTTESKKKGRGRRSLDELNSLLRNTRKSRR